MQYVEYLIESANWFMEYGTFPRAGGLDDQPRVWVQRMGHFMKEMALARYRGLTDKERAEYKPREITQTAKADTADGEW